jgi:hypothetical protein
MPRFGGAFHYEPSALFRSTTERANAGLSIRADNSADKAQRAAVLAVSTD